MTRKAQREERRATLLLRHYDLYDLTRWPAQSARVQPGDLAMWSSLYWHDYRDQGRACA